MFKKNWSRPCRTMNISTKYNGSFVLTIRTKMRKQSILLITLKKGVVVGWFFTTPTPYKMLRLRLFVGVRVGTVLVKKTKWKFHFPRE